jgi:aspartate 1-decarboxylase
LLDAADIREYQQIDIHDLTNGEHFMTYSVRPQRGSGVISINGALAHRANPADIIIASCAMYSEVELQKIHPELV